MKRNLFPCALAACTLSLSAANCPAFELSEYSRDQGKPAKTLKLKTASKKTIAIRDNAFEKTSLNPFSKDRWNPLSRRSRTLRRYEKATRAGGYANINMPFQSTMWAPKMHNKDAKVAQVKTQRRRHWF